MFLWITKATCNPAMRVIALLFTMLLGFSTVAQDLPTLTHGFSVDTSAVHPILRSLQRDNQLVIAFRVKLADKASQAPDYFIMTKNSDKLTTYVFSRGDLKLLGLNQKQLLLVWNTFRQNDLFGMRDEKDIPNFCAEKYKSFNSYTYEFTILTGSKMKTLSFNEPEYYDIVCFGMDERKKIINSAEVVALVRKK